MALLEMDGDRRQIRELPRGGGEFSIGRAAGSDWQINSPYVSRIQATLVGTEDSWRIWDGLPNGSARSGNGTMVASGSQRSPANGQLLRPNDIISFGGASPVSLVFRDSAALEQTIIALFEPPTLQSEDATARRVAIAEENIHRLAQKLAELQGVAEQRWRKDDHRDRLIFWGQITDIFTVLAIAAMLLAILPELSEQNIDRAAGTTRSIVVWVANNSEILLAVTLAALVTAKTYLANGQTKATAETKESTRSPSAIAAFSPVSLEGEKAD